MNKQDEMPDVIYADKHANNKNTGLWVNRKINHPAMPKDKFIKASKAITIEDHNLYMKNQRKALRDEAKQDKLGLLVDNIKALQARAIQDIDGGGLSQWEQGYNAALKDFEYKLKQEIEGD